MQITQTSHPQPAPSEGSAVTNYVDRLFELTDRHLEALRLIVNLNEGPRIGQTWSLKIDTTANGGRIDFRSADFSCRVSLADLKEPLEELALLGLVYLNEEFENLDFPMTWGKKCLAVGATPSGIDVINHGIIERAFLIRDSVQKCLKHADALINPQADALINSKNPKEKEKEKK